MGPPSSPIKILGKSVQGFLSYDRSNKHTLYTVQDGDEGPDVLLGLDTGKSMEDYIKLYFKEKDSDKEILNINLLSDCSLN